MIVHHFLVFLSQRCEVRRPSCRDAASNRIIMPPLLLAQPVPLHKVAVLLHDGVVPLALVCMTIVCALLQLEQRRTHGGCFLPRVHRMLLQCPRLVGRATA